MLDSEQENKGSVKNGGFDPFADLMVMQGAMPDHWWPVNLRTLSPFQRALVAMDGTVTKFLEAYLLEPIDVVRLSQQKQQLQQEHLWLAAAAGTSVIARQVLLRGRYSATVYAYAVSLLLVDRLPADVLRGLDLEPSGLGRILLNSQLENRREILWYGRETIADLPEAIEAHTGIHFISRTYRILVGNRPMMLINEKFPIDSPVGQGVE